MDLKTFLLKNVGAKRFYEAEIPNFEPGKNVACPFHKDDTPSLSIDLDNKGRFICYGCGAKGTSWLGFYAKREGLDDSFGEALRKIYAKYVRPIVPQSEIDEWRTILADTPSVIEWLEKRRGIRFDVAELYHLGWDGYRLTIPVYTQWGFAINVRKYDITKRSKAKIVSYDKGYGAAHLYPLQHFNRGSRVYLFEGELDTLLARQMGFNALTTTGGVQSWSREDFDYLADSDVTICFDVNDVNDVGQRSASEVASKLRTRGCTVRVVQLPIDIRGGDFTDYVVRCGGSASEFRTLELQAMELKPIDPALDLEGSVPIDTTLEMSDSPDFYGRRISLSAHVVGKGLQPYELPVEVSIKCLSKPEKMCEFCVKNGDYSGTFKFSQDDPSILAFADTSDERRNNLIKKLARCHSRCQTKIEITKVAAFEDIAIVPVLDQSKEGGNYVLRRAYTLGRGLRTNASYHFTGCQVPDPKNQRVTYLFDEADPAYDSIESFVVTDEVRNMLKEFQTDDIEKAQSSRYEWYAQHVSQIYGRRYLHEAIDLVYFSPIGFTFNGRTLRKGWLEVVIVGDTRTGKGYVAEGLQRFYGLGEVASAENCSFAGLVGGMQQLGTSRSWAITWGIIPRNDRRLVILDEVSALSLDDIARMSRIRSEGIAEIVKIHAEKTLARTRLIWLGNPRDERRMSAHEYGVEVVRGLIGKNEDISRFDYAFTVAHDEVQSDLINQLRHANGTDPDYDRIRRASKMLVLWAWSRRPDQVKFTEESTLAILKLVPEFSKRYSSTIPLIQRENFSEKLAKISAAVAARVWSTDDKGHQLIVRKEHVVYAARFIQRAYDSPSMGYQAYSVMERLTETMAPQKEVAAFFASFGNRVPYIIEVMMRKKVFTVQDIQLIFDADQMTAREITNKLLQMRVLKPQGGRLAKTSSAIHWFKHKYQAIQKHLAK